MAVKAKGGKRRPAMKTADTIRLFKHLEQVTKTTDLTKYTLEGIADQLRQDIGSQMIGEISTGGVATVLKELGVRAKTKECLVTTERNKKRERGGLPVYAKLVARVIELEQIVNNLVASRPTHITTVTGVTNVREQDQESGEKAMGLGPIAVTPHIPMVVIDQLAGQSYRGLGHSY